MKEMFWGHVVKDWIEQNVNFKKHYILNKVLVYECVMFCNKCWKHRNEAAQDETKQRERLTKWYEKERNEALGDECNSFSWKSTITSKYSNLVSNSLVSLFTLVCN